jgi:hypothetical protein
MPKTVMATTVMAMPKINTVFSHTNVLLKKDRALFSRKKSASLKLHVITSAKATSVINTVFGTTYFKSVYRRGMRISE